MTLKTSDYKEIQGGHRFCRNPGALESEPWCYIENNGVIKRAICDVPHCSKFLIIKLKTNIILILFKTFFTV